MDLDPWLQELIARLVVDFPMRPSAEVERIAITSWWMFDSATRGSDAHHQVTEWFARSQLATLSRLE